MVSFAVQKLVSLIRCHLFIFVFISTALSVKWWGCLSRGGIWSGSQNSGRPWARCIFSKDLSFPICPHLSVILVGESRVESLGSFWQMGHCSRKCGIKEKQRREKETLRGRSRIRVQLLHSPRGHCPALHSPAPCQPWSLQGKCHHVLPVAGPQVEMAQSHGQATHGFRNWNGFVTLAGMMQSKFN